MVLFLNIDAVHSFPRARQRVDTLQIYSMHKEDRNKGYVK